MDWLERFRDRDVIKVVTGVRRCGKSTVLRMFASRLIDSGVEPGRIHVVNLEDPDNFHLVTEPFALYKQIVEGLVPGQANYVFIDEIQRAPEFQRVAAGLRLKEDVDLYLTGSSSYLLSGELATLLSGRYVAIPMLPLSFREYLSAQVEGLGAQAPLPLPLGVSEHFERFLRRGSMPGTLVFGDDEAAIDQYLAAIVDTVLFADVAPAARATNSVLLADIVAFLADSIGSLVSIKKIADTLTSRGRTASRTTVEKYLAGVVDAYLFTPVRRWDTKGKRLLGHPGKYYIADVGLRHALLGRRRPDRGHVLENIVFAELTRRGGKVTVGAVGTKEVDFVVSKSSGTQYIQVAASALEESTLARELAPLRAIGDLNPRLLLTGDLASSGDQDGIQVQSIQEWLLATPDKYTV
jgi:predicted AAA+ superfamily ATPase